MRKIFELLCVLSLLMPPVFALNANSLYHAEIPVSSQSPEARLYAEQEGLKQVLVKLTTDPSIIQNPEIKATLEKADYYVQEFSYSQTDAEGAQYVLNIIYDKADINKLIRRADLHIWDADRPQILVWLTFTKDSQIDIVTADPPGPLFKAFDRQSKAYGLPMTFPTLSIDDLSRVKPDYILAFDIDHLKKFSSAYAPDAYLLGNISYDNNVYQSEWHLIASKDSWQWKNEETDLNKLVEATVTQITHDLSKHVSVKREAIQDLWIKLEISKVMDKSDLALLMDYLKATALVKQVQLSEVDGDVVRVAVLVHGNLGTFIQQASIGQKLILRSQYEDANILLYEWVH